MPRVTGSSLFSLDFFSTFNCCLLLGVTERGARGAHRIPPGCLGNSWPSVFITKGGNWGSVDPDFKESPLYVNYETWKSRERAPRLNAQARLLWDG